MPGYAECFADLWDAPAALLLARHTTSAEAVRHAGLAGLQRLAAQAKVVCHQATLHKILVWAQQAPPGHPQSLPLRRLLQALDDDRLANTQEIRRLEGTLAHLVGGTPYVLLLVIPGINVVTIADLAGELGPIQCYLNANALAGRAGLVPARYQSDLVDCHGPCGGAATAACGLS